MYDKPEFPPLLSEGLHPMSLAELEELCVKRFPHSRTRHEIMSGFRLVIQRIVQARMDGEVWVNGSFLTEKIDPADIDIFVNIHARYYDSGTEDQIAVVEWLISRENEPRKNFHCDTDVGFVYPEDSPERYVWNQVFAHWKRLFGFSAKTGDPKGIVVLRLSEIPL